MPARLVQTRAQVSVRHEQQPLRHVVSQQPVQLPGPWTFAEVRSETGEHQKHAFEGAAGLLALHATAEGLMLRSATKRAGHGQGSEGAGALNQQETDANEVLQDLESLEVASAEFQKKLAAFEKAVDSHAEAEEHVELPLILQRCDESERTTMGSQILGAEKVAPTHPHPSTAGSTAGQCRRAGRLVDRPHHDTIGSVTS
jgi:hypothetical protein